MRDKDKSEQQTNNGNGYNSFIFPTSEHCHDMHEGIIFWESNVDIRLIMIIIAGLYKHNNYSNYYAC